MLASMNTLLPKKTKLLTWPVLHQGKLALTLLVALLLSIAACSSGMPKTWQQIDMFDVVGESAASLMALFWLWLLMISRPRGRVTNWLLVGTSLYWLTTVLDLIDEFIKYPADMRLFAWLESLPVPIGMVMISIGLVQWLAEQQSINRQLAQREHFQREHQLIDPVTQLYNARYFMLQLQREIALHRLTDKPLAVAIVDIDGFAQLNRRWGMAVADNCLRSLAGAIELRLRAQDLACRFTSDRFVMLLPETTTEVATAVIDGLHQHSEMLQPQPLAVTAVTINLNDNESADELMTRLTMRLDWQKRCRYADGQGAA